VLGDTYVLFAVFPSCCCGECSGSRHAPRRQFGARCIGGCGSLKPS